MSLCVECGQPFLAVCRVAGHHFVEPSPPPPTENARAGADDECFGSCDRTLSPRRIAEGHTLCVWCQNLWDRAIAAGRARGIEEAVAKVRKYGRDNDEWGADAIADAIAKEGT